MIQSHNSKRALKKDNVINDFYHDWSIVKTCDTVTIESSHPLRPPNSKDDIGMVYSHQCNDDEISYFKVDMNLINSLPWTYLGSVR